MPTRAFVPAPLSQAEPRVYRSFRGRQMKGLFIAAAGAALGLLIFGARSPVGFGATFLMALPGFVFGYYQPEGKPVEYWLQVWWRYAARPRSWQANRTARQSPFRKLLQVARAALRARRIQRMTMFKEGS